MPSRRRRLPLGLEVLCEPVAKLYGPAANALVADIDPLPREQFFDVSKAKIEAEVKPDRPSDHIRRKTMTFE